MIRNQWYAVLESTEVKPGKTLGVTRMGEKLVFWRDAQGNVVCQRDWCPHRGVALSAGKLMHDTIQCPFHGFEFDSSGRCTVIPANGMKSPTPKAMHVHTYPARDEHGFIWIWWGEPREKYPPITFFDAIDEAGSSYGTIRSPWASHYSRAIENQLDVVHLPFVHAKTIGSGGQTIVDGPMFRWKRKDDECNWLDLWFDNRVDDGGKPRTAEEMGEPTRRPLIQFIYPNLWHNWLGEKLHLTLAFAPIDDGHTMMYVRAYQKFMTIPILRDVFNVLSNFGNGIILNEDKRVVITQTPKRSDLRIGETLIVGDAPIIEYRRRRAELIGVK
jgi:phenylpropionate dioxygenase-like ring-hydroxylating dioxygenase large terminal subunit